MKQENSLPCQHRHKSEIDQPAPFHARGLQPDSRGNLLFLLFSLQFSFFLGSMLSRLLLLLLAFVLTSLVTHICSSLLENDLHRTGLFKHIRDVELWQAIPFLQNGI